MKPGFHFITAVILILFPLSLLSQGPAPADGVYGLDPYLYNGRKYTYFLPSGTGGHQYLQSPDYFIGSVTLQGKTFEGVTLNYDIYNQQLLLQYATDAGSMNIIEVSKAWLECFRLGGLQFIYTDIGEGARFYQALGDGKYQVLCCWRKDLKLDVAYSASHFAFTPPIRSNYVLIQGRAEPFHNRRSFTSLFGAHHRQSINEYIRKNDIRLRKASDGMMAGLINYISSLE